VKTFLVDVLMTGSGLGENSKFCFPWRRAFSSSCYLAWALLDHLVVGFFGGIVTAIETNHLGTMYKENWIKYI
jgi:hypothetical protein